MSERLTREELGSMDLGFISLGNIELAVLILFALEKIPAEEARWILGTCLLACPVSASCGQYLAADLAPHDLRRSHAKLAHRGGVDLAQLSKSLGHASLSTTERNLGVDLDLAQQPCDFIKLKLNGRANGSN